MIVKDIKTLLTENCLFTVSEFLLNANDIIIKIIAFIINKTLKCVI